jgi:hypothetical protein
MSEAALGLWWVTSLATGVITSRSVLGTLWVAVTKVPDPSLML